MHLDEVRFRIIPWRASGDNSLCDATGMVLVSTPSGGASHVGVGREADFCVEHSCSSVITIGRAVGHLFAGQFLRENSTASASTYLCAFCSFRLWTEEGLPKGCLGEVQVGSSNLSSEGSITNA
jgi:hypothetical protein